jgi:hypothetical protein
LPWILAAAPACTGDVFIASALDGGDGDGSTTQHDGGGVARDGSPGADGGALDATPGCSTNADCPSNEICGFLESLACVATGQCFPAPGAVCEAYSPGCACDGQEINIGCTGLPTGYSTQPLLHTGACLDAAAEMDASCVSSSGGPCGAGSTNGCSCAPGLACVYTLQYPSNGGLCVGDAGTPPNPLDAGGPCTDSSNCATGQVCAYLESEACSATGQCVPQPAVTCNLYQPGCACDGTMMNIACNGLPSGYETKPLRHAGACVDGG